ARMSRPPISGITTSKTTAALKADQHTRDTPVVMVTAFEDQIRARDRGAADYVVKPIRTDTFGGVIDSVIQRSSQGASDSATAAG
ncbi:MAG: hypothetical protein AAF684_11820, partial [Pseudomonadota bacterium]